MENLKRRLKRGGWEFGRKAIFWLAVVLLAVIAGGAALSVLEIPNGIKLYTVQSGSMAPAISVGGVVVVKPLTDYQKEDVITFKAEKDRFIKNSKLVTTHRIIEVKDTEKGVEYVTKGDFNSAPDTEPVKKDLVLGKVLFYIPFLGYPISFVRTLPGLVILIIIPATLLIYSEILNIKREVARIKQERKKKKEV